MKLKKVFSIFGIVLFAALLYLYACMVFLPKNENAVGGKSYFQGREFLAEPEKSLDVIIFGNSSVYSGIIPAKLYEEYGYTSFASGVARQNLEDINTLLNKAIKLQAPKLVVLETSCFYIDNAVPTEKLSFLGAPFEYHYRWKSLKLQDFITFPSKYKQKAPLKGYVFSNTIKGADNADTYMNDLKQPAKMKKETVKKIKKFVTKCQKKNVKVLFLTVTNTHEWNYGKHQATKELADKLQVEYIDFNCEAAKNVNLNYATDFRDNGTHLNRLGAEKTTHALGKHIYEFYNNLFTTNRPDDFCESWQRAVLTYNNLIKEV